MRLFKNLQNRFTSNADDNDVTEEAMSEQPTSVSLNDPLNNNNNNNNNNISSSSSTIITTTQTLKPCIDASRIVTPETEDLPLLRTRDDNNNNNNISFSSSFVKRGFVLAFENVSLEVRVSCFQSTRFLLHNVSGYLLPGTINIIMCVNQNCSGKMLEVLAGIEERAAGSVMANALPVVSTAFRKRVALIKSFDVCSTDATVRSNLLFAVRMRVVTEHEHLIVRETAEAIHLQQFLDIKVDQLTPSQQYQLAIGMELVQFPMFLALDNPTRNLSSGEMYGFVSVLQNLISNTGRVIVLSATDVSRILYEAADNFIMLGSEGQLLYSGPKSGVEEFFQEHLGIRHVSGESIGEILTNIDENLDSTRVADIFANSTIYRRILFQVKEHRKSIASNNFNHISRNVTTSPSYFRKWFLLTVYTCRRSTIGHRGFVYAWAILFFLFFLTASLIAGSGSDQNAMQNKRGIVFFLLSCSMQVNIVLVDAEVREFFSGVHLRNNNYFDTIQYFTATVIRLVLPRAVFAVFGAFSTLFILSSSLGLVLTMGLMSLAHASLTLLLVYWHPIERDLWLVQNIYYGYCIILSGFLICLPTVPKIFPALSLLRYGYGGVVASELRDNHYSCDANATASYCYTGNQYLDMEGFTHDSWRKSSLILFLISVVVLALVGLSMKLVWIPRTHG